MEITARQQAIIIGSILGDGNLEQKYRGTRLQLKQAETKQEYIFWLYNELSSLCKSSPKQRKDNGQWYVSTRSLREITSIHQCFYENGVKFVPENISEILRDPLSLAIWFMDDGSLDWRVHDHYAFRLSTNCFTAIDHERLIHTLQHNFAVHATFQKTTMRGKIYLRIHIGCEGQDTFVQLIRPYILGCFQYKLPPIVFNPSET